MHALKRELCQEISGICVWCHAIKEEEMNEIGIGVMSDECGREIIW